MSDAQREIAAVLQEVEVWSGALTDEQMNWRPAPGVWSVAECLDHLTITCRRMQKAMDAGVDQLRERNQLYAGPAQPGFLGRWFLRILEPPVRKMKTKTPADFVPKPDRPAHVVRSEFAVAHQELLQRVPEFEKWHQNAHTVVSPFQPSLRYSLGLSLKIIPAHMRRHLWQARTVLAQKSS